MTGSKWLGFGVAICFAALVAFAMTSVRAKSQLPGFDSAEFFPTLPKTEQARQWTGPEAGIVRTIFEGVPEEPRPDKSVFLGQLRLLKSGRIVGVIDVFSESRGRGLFKIGSTYYSGYDQEGFQQALQR